MRGQRHLYSFRGRHLAAVPEIVGCVLAGEAKLLPGCVQDHRLVVEIEEREVWTKLVICIRLCLPYASMFEAGRQIPYWITFPRLLVGDTSRNGNL
jgi:hypothetical protein